MLGGDGCVVRDGINGGGIVAITMQDAEPVDDVVVALHGEPQTKVFISAKQRAKAIALTEKSSAFADVIGSFVRQFLQLVPSTREHCRLMWAVPSSAGASLTQNLIKVLDIFREDASADLAEFLRRRQVKERDAMKSLIAEAKALGRRRRSERRRMENWVSLCERFMSRTLILVQATGRKGRRRNQFNACWRPDRMSRGGFGENWKSTSTVPTARGCERPQPHFARCSHLMGIRVSQFTYVASEPALNPLFFGYVPITIVAALDSVVEVS